MAQCNLLFDSSRFIKHKHAGLLISILIITIFFWSGSTVQAMSQANESEPLKSESTADIAAELAAGLMHSAMINYDSQLYVWGDNTYGQLGLGNLDYSDTSQLLNFPADVVSVSLGNYHSLAALADGSVWSWGRNAYGQLGTGNTENASEPLQISGLPAVTQVAAGAWHSLALGADGSVWAWGNNTDLQVGDVQSESITDSAGKVLGTRCSAPVMVVAGGAVAIAAGGHFSMYLDGQGRVFAWGNNQYGQLGDGTTQSHARPVQIQTLSNIISIAAGYQHALALSRQNDLDALMVWGDDSLGQLGLGSEPATGIFRALPERLDLTGDQDPANDRIISIHAGYSQSAVVVPGEDEQTNSLSKPVQTNTRVRLLVWGNNASGQLALGNTNSQNKPTPISGTFNGWAGSEFLPFDDVAFGGSHMLVLSSKGLAAAAGRGDRGQLGNQSVLDRLVLSPLDLPDVIRPGWIEGCQLAAAVSPDGELTVRWPAAQDNRRVAGYRVRLRRADGQEQEIDAGLSLSCTFSPVSNRQAYAIMVMAYDEASVEADDQSLSRLSGWLPPQDAPEGVSIESYFSDWYETVWQMQYAASNWQKNPQGLLRPLEVPWDVSRIYDPSALPYPPEWQGFSILAWSAAILLLAVLLDTWRRQYKRRRHTKVTAKRIDLTGHYQ